VISTRHNFFYCRIQMTTWPCLKCPTVPIYSHQPRVQFGTVGSFVNQRVTAARTHGMDICIIIVPAWHCDLWHALLQLWQA